jgi:tripartite ATP-independent transporter DctM subunit
VELYFLALLMLLMAGALASGYPVAFALPGSAIISILFAAICGYTFEGNPDAYFAQGGPSQWLSAGVTNLRGVYWEVERDTLIAIPLFIFMGIMLQRSRIAEDLLLTMARLFGPVPGGLGISVVFVGALLAATTGILGATVVAMGLISLPAMLRNGYSKPLASGVIAASGTLGQIIPPSIVLIILADQLASAVDQAGTSRELIYKSATGLLSMPSEFGVTSTSAGEMFMGAFVPGLVLVGLYMLFVLGRALVNPDSAPAVQRKEQFSGRFLLNVILTLVPPLTLIFLVLGSIIAGIATVNQAGAIGAAGAMLMAGYRLREGQPRAYVPAIIALASLALIAFVLSNYDTNIKNVDTDEDRTGIMLGLIGVAGLLLALIWSGIRTHRIENTLYGVMVDTAKTSSLVFIIILGAAMLTAAFRAFGGEELVRDFLNGLPGGFWSKFVIVMGVIFILGFFLDFIEIAVVVVPIVAPILLADPSANITAVWLGVMIGLNVQTSFLTPPFGFALFYLRGVAPPEVRTIDMYKGVVPFIALQLIALCIVGYLPQLVNYLPNRVSLLAETAPPPRNPKLQYCLEQFVADEFAANGTAIAGAISTAQAVDLGALPRKHRKAATDALASAATASTKLEAAFTAENQVVAAAVAYRPIHSHARFIENKIRTLKLEIAEIEDLLDGPGATAEERELGTKRVASLQQIIEERTPEIPDNWKTTQTEFNKLLKIERDARLAYRRAGDNGYAPIVEIVEVIDATPALAELSERIVKLRDDLAATDSPKTLMDEATALSKAISAITGTSKLRSRLGKVRKELRRRSPRPERALKNMDRLLKDYNKELGWRRAASKEVLPALNEYLAAVKSTVGLRSQQNMTREQALFVAACSADHRDISLNF